MKHLVTIFFLLTSYFSLFTSPSSLCLYRPGDYGSTNWRIPALLCLDDGTLLAVNDKRKHNEGDLPEDIDIVCRRSTDGGHIWTHPHTIVQGTGRKHGYGDPALVQCENGDVLCLFAGLNGYFQSQPGDPICIYLTRSTDRGLTWSDTLNLTSLIWDPTNTSSPSSYRAAFVASGNGLRLQHGPHAGRILFAVAALRNQQYVSDNYVIYSDDNGHSWHRSHCVFAAGDEAKLVELNPTEETPAGSVLISVRRQNPDGTPAPRGCNRSLDGGVTWGTQSCWPELTVNACNGDILRLNDTTLIHSLPNSTDRRNVSLFISNDEGRSWHSPVTLYEGPSAYSSLTLLPDGSIAAYVERNPDGPTELWFYRLTSDWLLKKAKTAK